MRADGTIGGNSVIVAGRTKQTLEKTAQGHANIHCMTFDAADDADTRRFAQELRDRFPDVNVLFNNAGIMPLEDLTSSRDLENAARVIDVNLMGPIRLIDTLIDHLKRQDHAAIVNTTSGLGFVPMPGAATYSATKAALHSYTIALRHALRGQVELIELILPGVQTHLTPGQEDRDGYMDLDAYIDEVMELFAQEPTPNEMAVKRMLVL